MKISWKLSLILGFSSCILAYSLYWYFDKLFYFMMEDSINNTTKERMPDGKVDYSTFYKLATFGVSCYTHTIYSLIKKFIRHPNWVIISLVVFLTVLNSLIDELFFNPTDINLNEYIGFGIIIFLVFLFKNKWTK